MPEDSALETTIAISKELRDRLKTLKTHPRQSYAEVIENLLEERVTASE